MFNKDKVRKEINRRGWSERKLANEAHIAQSTISDILNGKIPNPKADTLLNISEALELPIDYFFDRGKKSCIVLVEKNIPQNIKIVEDIMSKMKENEQRKVVDLLKVVFENYF